MPQRDGRPRAGDRGERGWPQGQSRVGHKPVLLMVMLALVGGAAVGVDALIRRPDPSTRAPNDQTETALPGASTAGGGTNRTLVFRPTVTLTMPGGWTTDEHSPGNLVVLPPWGSLDEVDPGTSDYIGVYTRVAASSCAGVPRRQVPVTVKGIGSWLTHASTIVSTRPRQVSVGGQHGTVQDLVRATGAGTLPCRHGRTYTPLIVGLPPSQLDHSLIPGLAMRLYLLDYGGGVLAIEVDDILANHGRDMAVLDGVVRSMRFAAN
ncbi:MAG: hypothetical protein ABIR39_01280 [Nocardioides sp.]|uniref:hypothetical protein n=1 Tax=Nocardioides sp. TaxID=35761 RepID=UPI003266C549